MSAWSLGITLGELLLDLSWIGALLVLATVIRRYWRPLQEYLIPNNLVAGFIGLAIGMNGFGLIDLQTERLGAYVYHLLALLFVALSLRKPDGRSTKTPVLFGLLYIHTYLIQALLGMAVAFALIATLMPDLFPGIGFLMPLAFGMNPGIAYTIGHHWESHGFADGGVVGLTFAAIGFLVAYGVGMALVRSGIRRGEAAHYKADEPISVDIRTGLISGERKPVGGHLTTSPEAIESLTLHIGLIGAVYAATWLLVSAMDAGLTAIGAGKETATLWSFHFIVAAVMAMGIRRLIDASGAAPYIDDTTLTRLANLFMDVMIVASVAAIQFGVVAGYWLPVLLMSVVVGLATWITLRRLTRSLFDDHRLERFIAVFGNMTGTMQSAMALLRVLDPQLKSPVSHDLVYGSGLALALGFPLLLLINAPVNRFDDMGAGFAAVSLALLVYWALVYAALKWVGRR
jgi:ESS family glutamate:Na+ symporter